ncbi:hypothetical protein TNCT_464761 [Trichonephila clavata]|uniref:Uncharacterized protein n=1 Tax=Trichonephila clavata TaxID=2740835 RepID=A0A8X6JZU3_TRICU|nr:hypothetical protein TNCT_464761 [Trichonephila clavata]
MPPPPRNFVGPWELELLKILLGQKWVAKMNAVQTPFSVVGDFEWGTLNKIENSPHDVDGEPELLSNCRFLLKIPKD